MNHTTAYSGPRTSSFTGELQLLLSLCRLSLATETRRAEVREAVAHLLPAGIDWDELLRLTRFHRLSPLLGRVIDAEKGSGLLDPVPAEIRATVKKWAERNRWRALRATAELVKLTKTCRSQEIPALSLKGSALALQLHGDAGARHQGDIDLLARSQDFEKIHHLLLEAGYTCDATPGSHERLPRWSHHLEYSSATHGLQVELHSRLFTNPHYLPLNIERELVSAAKIPCGGIDLDVLDDDKNLLYLLAHGANHAWIRLKWLLDIAGFVRLRDPRSWQRVGVLARELGLERTLAQGLLLCDILLDTGRPRIPAITEGPSPAGTPLEFAARQLCAHPLSELAKSNYRSKDDEKLYALRHARYRLKLRSDRPFKKAILGQLFQDTSEAEGLDRPRTFGPFRYLFKPASWFYRKFLRRSRDLRQR